MELFRYRHLALGCAGYIVGLYVSYFYLGTISRLIFLAVSLICFFALSIAYFITKKRSVLDKLIKYAPLCIFIALSMLVSFVCFGRGENILKYEGSERKIVAEVTGETWESDYGGIYVIKISQIDGDDVKCEAVLESYDMALDVGNELYMYGDIYALKDGKYGFDERSAYLDDGILVSVSCEEITLTDGEIKRESIFKRVNRFLDARFENSLNSDTYALFSALLLGNKDNLDPSVRRDFGRLGLSHVLALSGMHITLLTTLLSLFLSIFKIPKPIRLVLLILSIAFFVALTGFNDSAIRAGLMMSIYYALRLLGRGTDSITSLLLSVTVILIFLPYHIFSLPLILSFLSMLGCIVSSKIIKYAKLREKIKRRFLRYVIYTFITTFVVLGFTSVVILVYFGEISVFSPFSNLVLVPVFTGFIYYAPFLLLLCGIPHISVPFVIVAESATKIIEELVGLLSRIRGISLPIYGFWQTAGLVGILGVFVIAMVVRRKYLFKVLATLSVFAVFFLIGTTANVSEKQAATYVSAFNYGDGDYLMLENKGKLNIIDISKAKRGDRNFASSLASTFCYAEIESYVLCNYSKDAPEYISSVLSWNIVRELHLPKPMGDEESIYFTEIAEIAKNQGTRVEIFDKSITLGDNAFDISRVDFERSVYDSVSISGEINGVTLAYFGASSYEAFDYFTEKHAPNADIIIFGESGPKYKLEYTYSLDSVDYAIYMRNSYDYASEKVKNATQGKEFFLKNDYARIKIRDT